MPKARNSKVDEALALYRQGLKLIEISRKLDIPEGTVRRWKCTYKWDAPEETERSQPKKPNARKRGGQPGNKNATGPPGNKNAEKFGFLSKYLPEETLELLHLTAGSSPLGSSLDPDPAGLRCHHPGPEDRLCQRRRRQDHREDRGPQRRRVMGREMGSPAGLGQAGQLYESTSTRSE